MSDKCTYPFCSEPLEGVSTAKIINEWYISHQNTNRLRWEYLHQK